MMHQQVERGLLFSGRPRRKMVIQKDEIISLKIDIEVLSAEEFHAKYFARHRKSHKKSPPR